MGPSANSGNTIGKRIKKAIPTAGLIGLAGVTLGAATLKNVDRVKHGPKIQVTAVDTRQSTTTTEAQAARVFKPATKTTSTTEAPSTSTTLSEISTPTSAHEIAPGNVSDFNEKPMEIIGRSDPTTPTTRPWIDIGTGASISQAQPNGPIIVNPAQKSLETSTTIE